MVINTDLEDNFGSEVINLLESRKKGKDPTIDRLDLKMNPVKTSFISILSHYIINNHVKNPCISTALWSLT